MRFGTIQRVALLGPFVALLFPYVYSVVVTTRNSSSTYEQRGVGILLVVALVAALVEAVAVSIALFRVVQHPQYRTVGNFIFLSVGMLPLASLVFVYILMAYGHG